MQQSHPVTGITRLTSRNLAFGYVKEQPIIENISAQIQPGKLCSLIGPNAAGKSTLLRLMLGQLEPWQGCVEIDSLDIRKMAVKDRAAILSYVPQRGLVSFAFTVEQVVAMGRYALQRDDAAVDMAIEQCDLVRHRSKIFSQLSAGQQQRVLLARALAQAAGQGKVMLLDEPGSAMDLWHQHQTMATLSDLAKKGMTILVVLHDLNLAARYADDIWLIDGGKLVAAGPWDDVLTTERLEPIYRVKLDPITPQGQTRPVFLVQPSDTISQTGNPS